MEGHRLQKRLGVTEASEIGGLISHCLVVVFLHYFALARLTTTSIRAKKLTIWHELRAGIRINFLLISYFSIFLF